MTHRQTASAAAGQVAAEVFLWRARVAQGEHSHEFRECYTVVGVAAPPVSELDLTLAPALAIPGFEPATTKDSETAPRATRQPAGLLRVKRRRPQLAWSLSSASWRDAASPPHKSTRGCELGRCARSFGGRVGLAPGDHLPCPPMTRPAAPRCPGSASALGAPSGSIDGALLRH